MKTKLITGAIVFWLGLAGIAHADTPAAQDPLSQALIAPEIVMAHQQELGLSEAQKRAIQTAVMDAQQRFSSEQWQLSGAYEKLTAQLKESHVDETKALSQLDNVLALERDIKHVQLTLMVKIKNELTPEQQAMARRLAAQAK